ncbi:unnamed protein product [Linum trigynum]|uniref:Major facilitator superfamily (MFS) profile domain-containing protein n=1 Tax=Linum trigynum TaxID=586398 RepID=A0AAV2D7W7_9ROSI
MNSADSVTPLVANLLRRNLHVADYQLTLAVVAANIAAMGGALVAGIACDYLGRKRTLTASGVMFLVGNLMKVLATSSYSLLVVGQVATGVATGFSLTVAPLFIAELIPSKNRGLYTALTEVLYNLGITFSYILNNVISADFPSDVAQRVTYGLPAFLSLMFVFELLLLLPESLYWLIANRGLIGDAIEIMKDSERGLGEIDYVIRQMRLEANIPRQRTNRNQRTAPATQVRLLWKEFIGQGPIRRNLMIVGGIHILRQSSGVGAFKMESLLVVLDFSRSGMFIANLMILAVRIFYASLSSWLVDRIGRRILLLSGCLSTGAFYLLFGLPLVAIQASAELSNLAEYAVKTVALLAMMGIMGAFEVGLGTVTWTITSEAFGYRFRAQGASIAVLLNRAAETVLVVTFAPLCGWIGITGASVLFCVVMAAGFGFCYFFVEKKDTFVLE